MSLPEINIDYVANLARLELSDEERAKLGSQLSSILDHFNKISAVDINGVEPMAHAQKVFNVWREGDEPGQTYSPKVLENIAPHFSGDQVTVPRVVE